VALSEDRSSGRFSEFLESFICLINLSFKHKQKGKTYISVSPFFILNGQHVLNAACLVFYRY